MSLTSKGFTLVEVVTATVVLSLVVLGLLSVFVAGNKHIIHTRERMSGAEIGKLFFDPLQTNVSQKDWGATNPLNLAGPTPIASQKANIRNFGGTYTTSPVANTDLRRVTANITWKESLQ